MHSEAPLTAGAFERPSQYMSLVPLTHGSAVTLYQLEYVYGVC